jgi:hypothetical protein
MSPDELFNSISEAERAERVKRGLPAHHVLDMTEFPFKYAAPTFERFATAAAKWAALEEADPGPQSVHAWTRVLMGDYHGADAAMQKFQALAPSQPLAAMRFSGLPLAEPAELPSVRGHWPTGPAFFIACDPVYLSDYALPLLRSIAYHAPGAAVHLHVMGNVLCPLGNIALQLSITTEDPTPLFARGVNPKMYYHAARLVRFAEALAYAGTLVMSDADALVTADPRAFLTGETGLRVRPGRIEPWHHFSACLIRGSRSGLAYFQTTAEIIRRLLLTPFWGLDQYALFAAYTQLSPRIELFGPDIASVENDISGLFWFTAGRNKLDLSTDSHAYARLFQKHSR